MLNKVLIVSSPTSEEDKTQSSLIYLSTILNKLDLQFDLLDLSGTIDYFDPPQEFISPLDSEYWLSPHVFHHASWLDDYLPNGFTEYDVVFYSALFSPDVMLHGRHAINQKKLSPNCVTIIGGAAISCLNNRQLAVISDIFDYVCVGYDAEHLVTKAIDDIKKTGSSFINKQIMTDSLEKIQPNYELLDIKPFITTYSGRGCNWGKCRFCNSANSFAPQYHARPATEIAHDFEQISQLDAKIDEVMLSSNSFTPQNLIELASCLKQRNSNVPYNIMLRGEKWISEELGELLRESGCTEVFIGAEALNDGMLEILNKGVNTGNIINAVNSLSKSVKVSIGLILFIPGITEKQLDEQLLNIEKILPQANDIEPEILSVVYGTEFADYPERYGINLWAKERNINDSWCYGLSSDIPWTFSNSNDAEIWFKYYDKLRDLIEDSVQPHYWDAIDYMRLRF